MILKESVSKQELERLENEKNRPRERNFYSEKLGNEKKRPILGEYAERDLEQVNSKAMNIRHRFDTVLDKEGIRQEAENIRYIEKKQSLCLSIYSLLKNICKDNYENEIYTFNLIPQFLIHVIIS